MLHEVSHASLPQQIQYNFFHSNLRNELMLYSVEYKVTTFCCVGKNRYVTNATSMG